MNYFVIIISIFLMISFPIKANVMGTVGFVQGMAANAKANQNNDKIDKLDKKIELIEKDIKEIHKKINDLLEMMNKK